MIKVFGCIVVTVLGLNTRSPPGAVAAEELGLAPMFEGNKKSPPLSPIADARFPTVTLSSGSVLIPIVASGVARWAIDDQTNMAMPAARPASRMRMTIPQGAVP